MSVGRVLKKIKYESELSQAEIAALLGCTQTSVSRLRRNLQVPKTGLLLSIIQLAKKYKIEVSIEDLLSKE